jgi:formylmethanofuran dehydrogenase subunit E
MSKFDVTNWLSVVDKEHYGRYEYRDIPDNIGSKTPISIYCKKCKEYWMSTPRKHHADKHACPRCFTRIKWTYDTFIEHARRIHGDKYDYSLITQDQIKNIRSRFWIRCDYHDTKWETSVQNHIYGKRGCRKCFQDSLIKWDLERFLKEAYEIHGTQFDYSEVAFRTILDKFWITCTICDIHYRFQTCIDTHIRQKSKCPECSGRAPYTLEMILIKGPLKHGEKKYDYSEIKEEHIQNCNSFIPVRCMTCNYRWSPSIYSHMHGSKCPRCSGCERWTKDKCLQLALDNHGEDFDFSQVLESHVKNAFSRIPITCNKCDHTWNVLVTIIVRPQCQCPNCGTCGIWTMKKFLLKVSKKTDAHLFNYSFVKEVHIIDCKSHIPVMCAVCDYPWSPSLQDHFHNGYGCPRCAGCIPLTYNEFIKRSTNLNGTRYNYSLIDENQDFSYESLVPIVCMKCYQGFYQKVGKHVNGHGCPYCNGSKNWNLKFLLEWGKMIFGNLYSYELVTESHVENGKSVIPVICTKCKNQWSPKVKDHINNQTGCPKCRSSKGERLCFDILRKLDIASKPQFRLQSLGKKQFDFYFEHNNRKYLLEYDGIIHFEFREHIHKTEAEFFNRQQIDVLKTTVAIEEDYFIIRIDYTNIKLIEDHLLKALDMDSTINCYFSNPAMYEYIIKNLPIE